MNLCGSGVAALSWGGLLSPQTGLPAWELLNIAVTLATVLPLPAFACETDHSRVHCTFHVLYGAAQLPVAITTSAWLGRHGSEHEKDDERQERRERCSYPRANPRVGAGAGIVPREPRIPAGLPVWIPRHHHHEELNETITRVLNK